MKTRHLIGIAAGAAAALASASSASAAVTYAFASTFFGSNFTVTLPAAVNVQTVVDTDSCFDGIETLACQVLFDPAGSAPIAFGFYPLLPTPVGEDDLFVAFGPGEIYSDAFPVGAFTTNGAHPDTNGFKSVTFEVSGIPTSGGVPEPASWALMIAGFGMLGAALRRRGAVPSEA